MNRKIPSALVLLCLLLGMLSTAVRADEGPAKYSPGTLGELIAAVMEINTNGGEAEITLTNDINLDLTAWQTARAAKGLSAAGAALSFENGTVTILGAGHSITADVANHRGITVSGNAVLNLGKHGYSGSLTVQGGGGDVDLLNPLIGLSGSAKLNMYDGAAVKDSLSSGTPGGVQLLDSAEFNMHGGLIENCNNDKAVAGGVVVDGLAVFNLCGGTIRGCKGYGGAVNISSQGRMEFSAGLIEDCESLNCGGAILLQLSDPIHYGGGGTAGPIIPGLRMTGGTIRNCKAVTPSSIYTTQYGGGVALYAYDAAAELTGGIITGCKAGMSGGGVACLYGKVTVDGCAVYDNTAAASADDVFNHGYGGTLTLGALPGGLTLTATGKPIDGWYKDLQVTGKRWGDLYDNIPAAIMTQGSLDASTQTHTIKAAHGAYYTVTYDLNGGTGTGYDPVSVAKGAQHTLLSAPTKADHVFTGWKVRSAVKRPGEKITVNAATTVRAQWLTVDDWLEQRLHIHVDVNVDVSTAGDENRQITADVGEESRTWLHAQVKAWIRDILVQSCPDEIGRENADKLYALITPPGADSIDATLTVGVRLTGAPTPDERALLASHMDENETAQVWQLTVELDAEAKKAGATLDQVPGFAITELDDPIAIKLTTGQDHSNKTVRVLYIHNGDVKTASSLVDADNAAVTIQAKEFSPYIILSKSAGSGGSTGPTGYTLRYVSNGGTSYPNERYPAGAVVTLDKTPIREGYTFTGWYAEPELTTRLDTVRMDRSRTVYAGWSATPVPAWLDHDDHFAYVYGYPDGHIGPHDRITRAEVAAIFFRLLREDVRAENQTSESPFEDVAADAWYVTEVSTLARLGVFVGQAPGIFAPDAAISRAEFAAVCARFDQSEVSAGGVFSDVAGHWAEQYILRAAALGWVQGYPDGSFRPGNSVTRAEAIAMINRVLRRDPSSKDDLLPGMKTWPDNPEEAWYYLAVQEATNGHDFRRKDDGREKWTALTDSPAASAKT